VYYETFAPLTIKSGFITIMIPANKRNNKCVLCKGFYFINLHLLYKSMTRGSTLLSDQYYTVS